jgi:hypothetical protein
MTKRLAVALSLCAVLAFTSPARSATLDIDALVTYATQTAAQATGTVKVTLAFSSPNGGEPAPYSYDLFSAQLDLLIGAAGVLTFNTADTKSTGLISNYWLSSAPTGNETAFVDGGTGEFRFEDFVFGVVEPSAGDVVAEYWFDFSATSAQFGTYQLGMGDDGHNKFADVLNNETFPNTYPPVSFQILPEPSTAMLLLIGGFGLLRRRR